MTEPDIDRNYPADFATGLDALGERLTLDASKSGAMLRIRDANDAIRASFVLSHDQLVALSGASARLAAGVSTMLTLKRSRAELCGATSPEHAFSTRVASEYSCSLPRGHERQFLGSGGGVFDHGDPSRGAWWSE